MSCPTLKVHSCEMKQSDKVKYLGTILSSGGTLDETITDRRNQGWSKVSYIQGLLSEVDMGKNRCEIGLMLRRSILVNSLLFSLEVMSNLKQKDILRLEKLDEAMLRSLTRGHSKAPIIFSYLETGSLKLRHMLVIKRLMFHRHLLTRDKKETIRKIYEQQKNEFTKGDWYQILLDDFKFIGEILDEDIILSYSKAAYKKHVEEKVRKASFDLYMNEKNKYSKLRKVNYEKFELQSYLKNQNFSNKERNLLYSLRSQYYSAKYNFKKMYQNDKCSLGCDTLENQEHIFQSCIKLQKNLKVPDYNYIFGDVSRQKEAIKTFLHIEEIRKRMLEKLLPGGAINCQDPSNSAFQAGAATVVL